MRKVALVLVQLVVVFAVPMFTTAAAYPAVSKPVCERAGGTFSVDKSTHPMTTECDVNLHDASVTLYNGLATGYVVQVSTSDSIAFYFMSGGMRSDFVLGGALGITGCWLNNDPVSLSDPNCVPTTPL